MRWTMEDGTMRDLVSREWLLKHMLFEPDREIVRNAPAENTVVTAQWDVNDRCTRCGMRAPLLSPIYMETYRSRYCPGCGAKMADEGGKTE